MSFRTFPDLTDKKRHVLPSEFRLAIKTGTPSYFIENKKNTHYERSSLLFRFVYVRQRSLVKVSLIIKDAKQLKNTTQNSNF